VGKMAAQGSFKMPNAKDMPDALFWTAVGAVFIAPFVLLKWLVTKPLGWATAGSYVALASWLSPQVAQAIVTLGVAVPAGLLLGWWVLGAVLSAFGFSRLRAAWLEHAGWRVRSAWRRYAIYGRRWRPSLAGTGQLINVRPHARDEVPRVRRVRATRYVERVHVRLVHGQTFETWERWAGELAHSFRARRVRVLEDRPGRIVLEVATADPLTRPVAPFPLPEYAGGGEVVSLGKRMSVVEFLQGVPVGTRDDGETWRMQVLGKHLLVAGSMGSGKGSVIYSTLTQLAPLIRAGLVEVWAGDPKGGMELGIANAGGHGLFSRFEVTPDGIARMLEDAADLMDARTEKFGLDGTRLHEPSRRDPLVLVVIDEIANLTAYGPKDVKDRVNLALGRLLSKGRAPAFVVFGALQDPRKEVLQLRNLFNTRVCLRVDNRVETNMVLGELAWEQGAWCDRIRHAPGTEQGVGYVRRDDARGSDRVRACWQSNATIRTVVSAYSHDGSASAALAETLRGPAGPHEDVARVMLELEKPRGERDARSGIDPALVGDGADG
jgi:DNA segregation ATPase FtsK/SpoIIIE, S-DNA-T family